ncbi:MAG: phosphoribosylanthranilate isomerase [Lentisphaeraceae bacterium]|nr:phosphoribosylanthranilate isomerase [Lentisphaeraceae bacterium]
MKIDRVIQIAGVIDHVEADLLMSAGVEYLGFPLRLPVNAVDHTEKEAAEIISKIINPHKAVLITYIDNATEVIEFCDEMKCWTIQLHGDISGPELQKLKNLRPEIVIFKSLVIGESTQNHLEEMITELSPYVDAFITDTFDPETGASGATGKTHDWSISKKFVELSSKPVILAGGLNAENVREAILAVKPAGVDSHTGVEGESGRKSLDKIQKFVSEAKSGFREIV